MPGGRTGAMVAAALVSIALIAGAAASQAPGDAQSNEVTIYRDAHGVPHGLRPRDVQSDRRPASGPRALHLAARIAEVDGAPETAAAQAGHYPNHFNDQTQLYQSYNYLTMPHAPAQYRANPESVSQLTYPGP